MTELRQLTPQEVIFVGGETPKIYQHTGGLIMLDGRGRPGFGFERFRQLMEPRLASIPAFRWKLHEVPLGLDLPYWVEDETFSFDRHLRRIAVPSPGDPAALGELVSFLYSKHMDRHRPLWEIWFIEGLPNRQFAVFQKMHHCIADGEGASKLMDIFCDTTPDAPPRPVDPAIGGLRAGAEPEWWRESIKAAWRLSRLPFRAGLEIQSAFWQQAWQRLTAGNSEKKDKPKLPLAPFNAEMSGERGLVFGTLPLADVRQAKSHFQVTVNDLVLALVGGALREHLQAQGCLPEESLRCFIAVSLRTEQDDDLSNKVTSVPVTLGTDLADPVERLRAIAAETATAKQEARGGSHKGIMEFQQMLPPLLLHALWSSAAMEKAASLAGANLLVSNVRGTTQPLYMAGLRITAIYPMSIIGPGMGINVTCAGYADGLHFGITIAPDLVPNPWQLIDSLHAGLREFLALAGGKPAGTRRKRTRREAATESRTGRTAASAPKAKPGARERGSAAARARKQPAAKRGAASAKKRAAPKRKTANSRGG